MFLPIVLLVAVPTARAATFPWEACGDWLGPVWFVVAQPDRGRGRAYGTMRCQSLTFGELPCRAVVAVGRMGVVLVRSNGTLFYDLRAMRSGTTQSILTFLGGGGGGTAYLPTNNARLGGPKPAAARADTIDGPSVSPAALLSSWLGDERAAGHLSSGLEVHTWSCPDGTPLGQPDLSHLGLVHVPHDPAE